MSSTPPYLNARIAPTASLVLRDGRAALSEQAAILGHRLLKVTREAEKLTLPEFLKNVRPALMKAGQSELLGRRINVIEVQILDRPALSTLAAEQVNRSISTPLTVLAHVSGIGRHTKILHEADSPSQLQ